MIPRPGTLHRWQSARRLGFGTKRPAVRLAQLVTARSPPVRLILLHLRCIACVAEFSRIRSRRRLAAPLARRQRRAQPWKARPAHAGPQRGRTQIKTAHTTRRPVRRTAIFLATHCRARAHRVNRLPCSGRDVRNIHRSRGKVCLLFVYVTASYQGGCPGSLEGTRSSTCHRARRTGVLQARTGSRQPCLPGRRDAAPASSCWRDTGRRPWRRKVVDSQPRGERTHADEHPESL